MNKWTKYHLDTAVQLLNRNFMVSSALKAISDWFDFPVTEDSLRRAFSRHGLKHPKNYLKRVNICDFPVQTRVPGSYTDIVFDDAGKLIPIPEKSVDKLKEDIVRRLKTSIYKDQDNQALGYFSVLGKRTEPVRMDFNFTINENDMVDVVPQKAERVKKILVCPDLHVPDHDKVAWQVFLNSVRAVKPDEIVLIGDFGDFLSISAHPKKPQDERSLKNELRSVNDALDELVAAAGPNCKIVYIFGNHEYRYDRYLASNAPELDGIFSLKDLLRLDERGIKYIPYGEMYKLGEMNLTHDVGRCGINTARQSLQDVGDNVLVGHSHRASIVYGGTVSGHTHVGVNVGWLGSYDAISYRNKHTAKREWQHAFCLIYQDKKGTSYCNLIPVINGECIVDGKFVDSK